MDCGSGGTEQPVESFVADRGRIERIVGVRLALGALMAVLVAALAPAGTALASKPIFDVGTIAALSTALIVVGILAGVLPAIRAARVPPAEALRAL
jgi:ABC-type antimicrobial peptide transport system permease subunit